MPSKVSAGLMMYHLAEGKLKIFLVHPGGPFFEKKDNGYWGIPKGLVEPDEDLLDAAKREFEEETGITPAGRLTSLGTVIQKSGKKVYAWSFPVKNSDPVQVKSNTFNLEWPIRSGKMQKFPEVDKGEFFEVNVAKIKINPSQIDFIDRLCEAVNTG